ncbi:hypothetical protein ZIOFF_020337 [Zingiber officinale]|uniref:Integrase catalytic domain-containing protein n=1 Tax=Zingiber officinale TaxID=94328 RepID=A0A8J5L7W2_ZINOF|nr:hypothetical protein ZIOFF_020337 [Zingiber officinale]
MSCPETPQPNGVAEQKIRNLVETCKCWLHAKNLPKALWAKGMKCATYVINRVPLSSTNNKAPYELLFGVKPNVEYHRVFGLICYIHVSDSQKRISKYACPSKINHKPEASKHDNVGNARHSYTVPQPFSLATEDRHGSTDEATASKEKHGGADNSHLQPDMKVDQTVTGYRYSVAPVHAASVKTCKGRTTVATAPTFRCIEPAEKRKEFYTKLEQKHHSMEAEKMQFEARMREEQEEALKEFRKNLNFKANPVLSLVILVAPKVPLTRVKSHKLTQTKSFSKANPTEGNKYGAACNRLHCHGMCPTTEAMKRLPNSLKNVKSQSFKSKEEAKPLATLSTTNQMIDIVGVQT